MYYPKRFQLAYTVEEVGSYNRRGDLFLRTDYGLALALNLYPESRELIGRRSSCCFAQNRFHPANEAYSMEQWEQELHSREKPLAGLWTCGACGQPSCPTPSFQAQAEPFYRTDGGELADLLEPWHEGLVSPLEERLEALALSEQLLKFFIGVRRAMDEVQAEGAYGLKPAQLYHFGLVRLLENASRRGTKLLYLARDEKARTPEASAAGAHP